MSHPRITPLNRRLVAVAIVLLLGRTALGAGQTPPAGTLQDATVPSKIYPPARHLWVYTPLDYPRGCADGCNVLLQSGAFWRGNEGSNGAPYEFVTSQYASGAKKEIRHPPESWRRRLPIGIATLAPWR